MSAQPQPTFTKSRTRVKAVLAKVSSGLVKPTHPAVDRMVKTYRMQFGLGPRDLESERAHQWRALFYKGERGRKVVATFGERYENGNLEITDAWYEGRIGKVAFLAQCYAYLALVDQGKVGTLIYTVLTQNPFWATAVKRTGELPLALVFAHRKKGA